MTSSFGTPGDTYYNPKTELNYVLGSDFAWRVDVSKGAGKSLHFKGAITPPADPASLLPAPEVGDYFIYDSDGTAWNGDDVLAGNWVIYNVPDGWKNYSIRQDTGVMSVDVSGGVLSLAGSAADPVIDLDAADLEAALDDKYLRIDGANDYEAQKLNFIPPTDTDAVTLNTNGAGGLAFSLSNVNALTVNPTGVTSSKGITIENAGAIEFKGSSGNRLNMEGTRWGALSSNGTPQLEWGGSGLKLRQEFNVNNKQVRNVLIPTDDDEPANKEYVDTEFAKLELKPATTTDLGGVIVGKGLSVTVDGTLSINKSDSDFVKKTGDIMTGELDLREAYPLRLQTSGGSTLMEWYRFSNTEIRQNVKAGKTFKLIGYDNGAASMCMQLKSKGSGDGNVALLIRNVSDPSDPTDVVNLRTLEGVADGLQDQIDLINVNPDDFLPTVGGEMTGPIEFTGGTTLMEVKDDAGGTNLVDKFIKIKATNRLRINFYPDQSNSGSKTAFEGYWDEATGFPVVKWNYLKDPEGNGNAVTLRYANNNYLKLSGGTLTGTLNTNSLIKSTRTTGGAFEVKPDGSSISTCLIHTSGEIKLKPNLDGSNYLFSIYAKGLDSNLGKTAFRVTADGKVKAGHDSSNPFIATQDNDVVTKKLLDDTVAANSSSGNMKVRIVSSTPSDVVVGDIWLNTTDNNLYIKKS